MDQELRTLLLIVLGVAIGVPIILCVICVVFLYRQEPPRLPREIAPGLTPADIFLLAWPDLRIRNLAGYERLGDAYDISGIKDA